MRKWNWQTSNSLYYWLYLAAFIGIAQPLKADALKALNPTITNQEHGQALRVYSASTDINFGRISGENGVCRMNQRGFLLGLQGQTCVGKGHKASFEIHGANHRFVHINAYGSDAGRGVSFTPRISGRGFRSLSRRGQGRFTVIGDLRMQSALDGKHALSYLLTVNYE
ncbi:MAG: hypothetical protein AB8B86_13495 [Pseudomonadales bacterium]